MDIKPLDYKLLFFLRDNPNSDIEALNKHMKADSQHRVDALWNAKYVIAVPVDDSRPFNSPSLYSVNEAGTDAMQDYVAERKIRRWEQIKAPIIVALATSILAHVAIRLLEYVLSLW